MDIVSLGRDGPVSFPGWDGTAKAARTDLFLPFASGSWLLHSSVRSVWLLRWTHPIMSHLCKWPSQCQQTLLRLSDRSVPQLPLPGAVSLLLWGLSELLVQGPDVSLPPALGSQEQGAPPNVLLWSRRVGACAGIQGALSVNSEEFQEHCGETLDPEGPLEIMPAPRRDIRQLDSMTLGGHAASWPLVLSPQSGTLTECGMCLGP